MRDPRQIEMFPAHDFGALPEPLEWRLKMKETKPFIFKPRIAAPELALSHKGEQVRKAIFLAGRSPTDAPTEPHPSLFPDQE